jgi:group I intron endonuclease
MYICRALLKHGYSNFSLEILEYCEPSKRLEREGFYQKKIKPEYNISKDPTAPMSGRKHSEESKKIMSDVQKKIDNPGRFKTGHKHSDETKQKISDAKQGQTLSDETKQILSDIAKKISHSGRFKPGQPRTEGSGRSSQEIEVFDQENNQTTTYDSICEAARALNIKQSIISMYLKNNQVKPYKGQYTFKKI